MAKMQLVIVGDASSAKRAMSEVGHGSESMASRVSGSLGLLGKTAVVAAGAAGLGALVYSLKSGYDEWKSQTKLNAQTTAAIKSTGHAANVTAGQVGNLSTALMRKTSVDDDAIQSGENMLLTFTNIRNVQGENNDIFTQSTKILTDMTVALNNGNVTQENMTKQAIQLGKALNDPVAGLSALKRVGVTFTQQQQDMIKKLVASGNTLDAQKLILHELNKEFGGSGAALGKTLPGQIDILKHQFENLTQKVFTKLVPTLTGITKWVNDHWPEISKVMSEVFTGIAWAVDNVLKPAFDYAVQGGQRVVAWVKAHWQEISAKIRLVMADARTVIQDTIAVVVVLWRHFGGTIESIIRDKFNAAVAVIEGIVRVIRGVVEIVRGIAHGDWRMVWQGIQDVVSGSARAVEAVMKEMVQTVWNILKAAVRTLGSVAEAIGKTIWNGLKAGAVAVINWILGQLQHIADAYNKVLGWLTGNITVPRIGGSVTVAPPTGTSGPMSGPHGQSRNADVTVNIGNVHGSADSDFAQRLAGELANQLRGGRVPAFQQAIHAV